METEYWAGRMDEAVNMARDAATAQARLAHYELAGRYSVRAADAWPAEPASDAPDDGSGNASATEGAGPEPDETVRST
jgi:hypothetical protein